MTSQLNVDTIVDKAGTGGTTLTTPTITALKKESTYTTSGGAATQDITPCLLKARSNTNSAGTDFYERFNIASLTDVATGQQRHNFTNPFAASVFTPVASMRSVGTTSSFCDWAGATGVNTYSFNGSAYVDNFMQVLVAGDLA